MNSLLKQLRDEGVERTREHHFPAEPLRGAPQIENAEDAVLHRGSMRARFPRDVTERNTQTDFSYNPDDNNMVRNQIGKVFL